VLDETISNIRVVKAFAMEKFEIMKFNKANHAYFRSLLNLFIVKRLASPLTELIGVLLAVAILWKGGSMVLADRGLTPEHFLEFIVLMFLLMQSANRLSDVHVKVLVGVAASDRVFEVIDMPSQITDPPDPKPVGALVKGINLRNVWYEYEPNAPVLRGIDLDVDLGENIAIVGPSGGGKSTLVDLLPRFFDPVLGTVEINGRDIREYRLEELRSLFGIVTQEPILFHDTIRANIAYGRPDIPMEDIEKAARTAFAHDFIMQNDKGYDTVIGDRGTKLSGGQKQRLIIARAILKNPPILIFDEATSALDSESEAEVQAAIDKLLEGRTSFVIAHRLSTIKKASRIIVIDNGRIVEIGCHAELYDKGGIYRRLSDLQFASKPV
jgi:subfamily B ATP-binding cassette protein MsbA